MNLIEQLGGYERAKNIHCGNAGDWGFYSVSCDWYSDKFHEGHGMVNIEDIEKELLKYRRQHNIFEVGDAVIIPSRGNGIFHFNALFSDSDIAEARHATDEEIKVGKRLEVG